MDQPNTVTLHAIGCHETNIYIYIMYICCFVMTCKMLAVDGYVQTKRPL